MVGELGFGFGHKTTNRSDRRDCENAFSSSNSGNSGAIVSASEHGSRTQLHGFIATSWQRPWPTSWRGSPGAPCATKDLRRPPSRGDGDLSQDLIRVRDGENAWNGSMNASRVWWHEWLLVNLSVNETKDACVFPSRPRPTSRSNRPDTYQRLPLSTHNLSCETQPVHTFVPLADSCAATWSAIPRILARHCPILFVQSSFAIE
jgi:hypothetical protein